MCQVWFHAFSVKSDQGSQRWPKGIAVYVNFSIPPSLVITQVKKSLKITFSSISPYSHNISFSPSSLHFRPDFSLLLTFSGHISLLPIVYPPPNVKKSHHKPSASWDFLAFYIPFFRNVYITCNFVFPPLFMRKKGKNNNNNNKSNQWCGVCRNLL